jgi:hypothetical protein
VVIGCRLYPTEAGYRHEMMAQIRDRNGRPILEAFRFRQ